MSNFPAIACALVSLACASAAWAEAPDEFQRQVAPFLKSYCVGCHNSTKTEGALDLSRFTTAAAIGEHFRQWEHVLTFVRKGEMPPDKAKQPTIEERNAALATIERLMAAEAKKWSGDPGVVLPRRLTVAEYNYTIRDLTGVDIRPAESFPVDPASGEGFNNTGEALVMSPNLFKKYYAAAQLVAEHVVLTPSGMTFAPYPAVTFADRVKFHEQAILRFYEEHDVALEAYLTSAWEFRHRPAALQRTTIDVWAAEKKLSPKYLRLLWDTLNAPAGDDPFPLSAVRREWHAISGPTTNKDGTVVRIAPAGQIGALAAKIRRASQMLCAQESAAIVSNAGNAPIQHLERRKKSATERDTFDETMIADARRLHVEFRKLKDRPEIVIHIQAVDAAQGTGPGYVVLSEMNFSTQSANDYRPADKKNRSLGSVLKEFAPEQWKRLKPGVHPLGHKIDAESIVVSTAAPLEINVPTKAFTDRPEIRFFVEAKLDREEAKTPMVRVAVSDKPLGAVATGVDDLAGLLIDPQSPLAARLRASGVEFCRTFPNRFVYVDSTRGLSAGFHLIEGVFRDDMPLVKLVLDDTERAELDRLWNELYFGTGLMEKMLRGFVFFERSERNFLKHADFDSFKEEDPGLVHDDTLARFEQVYLVRSGVKAGDPKVADHPVHLFFSEIRNGLKLRAEQFAHAKPIYLRQLLEFAERAYRRPLTEAERVQLVKFYETTSSRPELGIEQAVRGCVTSILVSPYFCCRIDLPAGGESVAPLADISLASRLSYFLWSSMPDEELAALAKAGKLNDEVTLRQQLRRMLKDPKVRAFALEFFGQWLRHRDFLEQESVDRRVFPAFKDDLKLAMFEEPTRMITHLIQTDRPVTDVLYGDVTFVNKSLAAHYGWPGPNSESEWQQVDGIQRHGRGGVLGMAVFLTAYSQPQRTSPVKRGFWVVHKILGEHIPAPPNDIAPLPAKETETNGKTIRQLLALHTEAEMCARCHKRFDPIGLSMEGFDPIGKARSKDLAGRPVDNVVKLPSGETSHGVPEFLKYIRANRNDDYLDTLCRKFLGYALGRSVEASDHDLLEKMKAELRRHDDKFSALFETVVCSPQFRNQRCRDFSLARFKPTSSGD
ncbi:MAG: DUF1592 domain-containing protein [Planctomycetia bacterium]|nr:DUF1592 domain-containing protein [Planctomycetia bacterium]